MGAAAYNFPRFWLVHRLLHLGCISGATLFIRAISFSDVLTSDLGGSRSTVVRSRLVGHMAHVAAYFDTDTADHAGDIDTLGSRRIPVYVLLLSRRLLQGLLG